jgi:hypothetical protein
VSVVWKEETVVSHFCIDLHRTHYIRVGELTRACSSQQLATYNDLA